MISFRPLMNSDRFLHRESIVYARATFAGSRVFQASSARRTFCIALSRVNGGKGGRAGVVAVAMISSPGIDSFGISINSRTRAGDLVGGRLEGEMAPIDNVNLRSGHYSQNLVVPILTIRPTIFGAFVRRTSSLQFRVRSNGVPACQREVNDRQQHYHESINKERAISQYENVTENYGSHPHNSQSRSQSGCLREQEQNPHQRLEH